MNWQLILLLVLSVGSNTLFGQETKKIRTVVMTDMTEASGNQQSLRQLLTYANQWDVEGIVATTSYQEKNKVEVEKIHNVLTAYEELQPKLTEHEEGFPTAADLKSKVKKGIEVYGMKGIGSGNDSEGSELLIQLLEKADDRPLWVQIWGSTNCLGQALWKIKQTKSEDEAAVLYQKLRVFAISNEEDATVWIKEQFPQLFFINALKKNYSEANNSTMPKMDMSNVTLKGGEGNLKLVNNRMAKGIMKEDLWEGGNLSILYLIENGLNEPERPDFGSWGGRYNEVMLEKIGVQQPALIWSNANDAYVTGTKEREQIVDDITLWQSEAFNDFKARMDWCQKPYHEANHPPVPKLDHPDVLKVSVGDIVELDATLSMDYDGNDIYFEWFHLKEAGTFEHKIEIDHAKTATASFVVPYVEESYVTHIVLKLTDSGTPSLTRYKRVILHIEP